MTDLQLEAYRANALQSTGPKTPEGKKRSSMNACRHRATAKIHIATPEEMEAFREHCDAYHAQYKPASKVQADLVEAIAQLYWRLKRSCSFESSIFAQGHLDHAPTMNSGSEQVDAALAEGKSWVEHHACLTNITLYETRTLKMIERHTKALEALQTAEKSAQVSAEREAVLQYLLAKHEGRPYDPAHAAGDPTSPSAGFVFSTDAIERRIEALERKNRAWNLSRGYNN